MLKKVGLLGIIIADLLGFTGAGIGVGYYLCNKLGAPWWVLILSSGSGLGIGMYRVYLLAKKDF